MFGYVFPKQCVWCIVEQRPFFSCTTSLCYCLVDIHGNDSSYSLYCWVIEDYKIFAYITQHDSIINPGNYRGNIFIMQISLSKILGPEGLSHVPEITQLICYRPRMGAQVCLHFCCCPISL